MSFLPIAVIAYVIYTVVKKAKATGGFESLMKEIQDAQKKKNGPVHGGGTPSYEYEEYEDDEYEEEYTSPKETPTPSYIPVETPRKLNNLLKESASSSTTHANKPRSMSKQKEIADIDESSVFATEKAAYRIKGEDDLKRAFVWSEILNRKYN